MTKKIQKEKHNTNQNNGFNDFLQCFRNTSKAQQ